MSKYRRANRAEECNRALEQQWTREAVAYFDHDGMLVLRARLSPEQGAVVMKALEVSADALQESRDVSAEPSSGPAAASSEPVEEPSGDQLKADALVRMAERALDADASGASDTDKYQVVVHVDAEVLAGPAADGRCELEEGPVLAAETVRRLACDASLGAMAHGPTGELIAGRKTRGVSTPLRRAGARRHTVRLPGLRLPRAGGAPRGGLGQWWSDRVGEPTADVPTTPHLRARRRLSGGSPARREVSVSPA